MNATEQKLREALADLHLNCMEAMKTGGWVPTELHASFWDAMANAKTFLDQTQAPETAKPMTEDERIAVDFYLRNPSTALLDMKRRVFPQAQPELVGITGKEQM